VRGLCFRSFTAARKSILILWSVSQKRLNEENTTDVVSWEKVCAMVQDLAQDLQL
jgi:hypothetical protein